MSRRKVLLLVTTFVLLVGCWESRYEHSPSGDNRGRPEDLYRGKITVGAVIWPGYTCLYLADGKGFFAAEGLDVDVQIYQGTSELSEDYLAGEMQGRANVTLEVVREQHRGIRHRVVAAIDFSNGADAIMAVSEIDSVAEFKGKRIAFEKEGMEELFLIWALEKHSLSIDDITPVEVNEHKDSTAALENQQADVAVTYEPEVSRLDSSGKFHRVYTSADAPGLITDVLTFQEDFIEEHPATVRAFLRAYFKAYEFWKQNPQEANEYVAQVLEVPVEEVATQQEGANILSFRDNRDAFSFGSGMTSLYGNMRRIHEFVQEHGNASIGPNLVATDQLIDPRFVRDLAEEFER